MGRTRSNAATCYGGRTGRGLAKEREAEAGKGDAGELAVMVVRIGQEKGAVYGKRSIVE